MEQFCNDVGSPSSMEIERSSGGYEEPLEGLEEAIARVWKELFRLERVGRGDNFFELGGDSLIGMELTELLADRLEIQVPVVTLFQNPTIRELAAVLGQANPLVETGPTDMMPR